MAASEDSSPHPVAARESTAGFGPTYIIEPKETHVYTAIVLHGRGSTGEEFAEEFLESTLSNGCTLVDKMPGFRWVFPSSKSIWSTVFQEWMPAWFEARSLTDPTARQDLQVDGLRDSVRHVLQVAADEGKRLGGESDRLVLGGISQGGAVGMWALMCQQETANALGAFFAASTWLPFAADIEASFASQGTVHRGPSADDTELATKHAILGLMSSKKVRGSLTSLPVFMGHGNDDAYVDVDLGRQAASTLRKGGWNVEWKEYKGAEEEGHWFKVPDEIDDIYGFLCRHMSNKSSRK